MPACGPVRLIGRTPKRVERHRDERRALVLAGREEDVELAWIRLVRDGRRQGQELVGGVAHRGHDDDEVRPGRALAGDPPRDALDAVGAGHGRATELLDDKGAGHGGHSSGGLPDDRKSALRRCGGPRAAGRPRQSGRCPGHGRYSRLRSEYVSAAHPVDRIDAPARRTRQRSAQRALVTTLPTCARPVDRCRDRRIRRRSRVLAGLVPGAAGPGYRPLLGHLPRTRPPQAPAQPDPPPSA